MSLLPENYYGIILRLKDKIRSARQKSVLAVNRELLSVYWEIGSVVLSTQTEEGWGTKVIDRLSADLKVEFPDMKGLSVRNLKYMRAFAEAYPFFGEVQDQLAKSTEGDDGRGIAIVQGALAQLPWYHHIALLDKVKQFDEREFYLLKAIENGWSRDVMVHQIESKLYQRQGKAITNFQERLPAIQSDLAEQTLKNPYVFDFLGFSEEIKERELEKGLMLYLRKFLLELGTGFAFVGNQRNLVVEGDDFFLDLLFYNYKLHCFVVVELKVGDFKPEFAGKLNFYVNIVNEQLRGVDDQPTIGILLCKTPNKTVVKYSLQGIEQPIGVSEYQLKNSLPKNFQSELPSIEELEAEIDKEYEELKPPVEQKIDQLKALLRQMKQPELKSERTPDNCLRVFDEVFVPICQKISKQAEVHLAPLFNKVDFTILVNHTSFPTIELARQALSEEKEKFSFDVNGRGLKQAGTRAFDQWLRLEVNLERYSYYSGVDHLSQENAWLEKLYHQTPSDEELEIFAERYMELMIERITQRVRQIKGEDNG